MKNPRIDEFNSIFDAMRKNGVKEVKLTNVAMVFEMDAFSFLECFKRNVSEWDVSTGTTYTVTYTEDLLKFVVDFGYSENERTEFLTVAGYSAVEESGETETED